VGGASGYLRFQPDLELFMASFGGIELHVGMAPHEISDGHAEVACHERRAVTKRKASFHAIANRPRCGLKIVDVSDDTARDANEVFADFGENRTATAALEQFNAETIFKV
jgi:hypothetical protein